MSRLKLGFLQAGITVLRGAYAVMKKARVRKRYVFITKLSNEPPLDFRVLADACRKRHPEYEVVMLCRTMKDRVRYIPHMFVQMHYLATSEVVFLDRSCLVVHVLKHKPSLQVVQLWHALGSMKKFGYAILDTPEGQSSELAKVCHMHENYTYILISSMNFIEDYREGFHTDGSNVVEIPLPRVDLLLDPAYKAAKRAEVLAALPQLAGKKTIVYCPTFRKEDAATAKARILDLVELIDFDQYSFVYQPHPLSKLQLDDERVVRSGFSTQDMLFAADVVISDYSSVMYEAGLLGLPVYLYAYDWDEYRRDRRHNLDIEKLVPTVFTGDARRLVDAIENEEFDKDVFARFIADNIHVPDGKTCCDAIIDLIDGRNGGVQ